MYLKDRVTEGGKEEGKGVGGEEKEIERERDLHWSTPQIATTAPASQPGLG